MRVRGLKKLKPNDRIRIVAISQKDAYADGGLVGEVGDHVAEVSEGTVRGFVSLSMILETKKGYCSHFFQAVRVAKV